MSENEERAHPATRTTEISLVTGERYHVEGDVKDVEETILDAARGAIMQLAWFIDADTQDDLGVNPEHVEKLAAVGIKHTKHLFERAMTRADRAALAEQVGVPDDALLELVKFSDLARIVGVGPASVRPLYDAGIDTPEAFLTHSVDELLEKVRGVEGLEASTKKDIEYCLETARYLPKAIEYA